MGFVFFALMGVVYFLTTYLQSVMGYDALEAGVRMLPVVGGLVAATKLSLAAHRAVRHEGRRSRWGLDRCSAALFVLAGAGVDTGYGRVAIALGMMGFGMVSRDVACHRVDHGLAAEG